MSLATRWGEGGLMGGLVVLSVAACSYPGDLNIVNNGPDPVTVVTGDEEITVDAEGAAAILDYGCTPGDVTIEGESGMSVVLPGPVCPDEQIVVGDGTAVITALNERFTSTRTFINGLAPASKAPLVTG